MTIGTNNPDKYIAVGTTVLGETVFLGTFGEYHMMINRMPAEIVERAKENDVVAVTVLEEGRRISRIDLYPVLSSYE